MAQSVPLREHVHQLARLLHVSPPTEPELYDGDLTLARWQEQVLLLALVKTLASAVAHVIGEPPADDAGGSLDLSNPPN